MKEEERKKKKMEKWGYFQQHENIDTIYLGFLYFGNCLIGVLKQGVGAQTKEAFKMVSDVRCFYNFIGSLL